MVRDPHRHGIFWQAEVDGSGVYATDAEGRLPDAVCFFGVYGHIVSKKRVVLFADLLANPTETVEVDE